MFYFTNISIKKKNRFLRFLAAKVSNLLHIGLNLELLKTYKKKELKEK